MTRLDVCDIDSLSKFDDIFKCDDSQCIVKLYHELKRPSPIFIEICAVAKAKKCLIELVSGEQFKPPIALDGNVLHIVASISPYHDVLNIMLQRGAIVDLYAKDHVFPFFGTPLQLTLEPLSAPVRWPLYSWSPGDSIFKLIILLCHWQLKSRLDAARLLASHMDSDSVMNIAETFVADGKLIQLAALLLVAREKVMIPNEIGITIQQGVTAKIEAWRIDHHRVQYKALLLEASKLFDVFERAGDALSLYCRSMKKHVSTRKVLVDIIGILQKAGFLLQFSDFDLRDCCRECPELWKPNLYKLSDAQRQKNHNSFSHPTVTLNSSTTQHKFPSRHYDPLIAKLKLGQMMPLASFVSRPRELFSTKGGQVDQTCAFSSIALLTTIPRPQLQLLGRGAYQIDQTYAYIAMKLKRGIIRCK